MKPSHYILFLFVFFACSTNTNNNKIANRHNVIRNYKLIIDDVIMRYSLGKTVSLDSLQNAVPRTNEEFLVYYHTSDTENKKTRIYFFKVDTAIAEHAAKNQGDFLRLYLELSSFVDGEYAESYYEDVDSIIEKNKEVFCGIYSKLSTSSKKYLEEYKTKYCK